MTLSAGAVSGQMWVVADVGAGSAPRKRSLNVSFHSNFLEEVALDWPHCSIAYVFSWCTFSVEKICSRP